MPEGENQDTNQGQQSQQQGNQTPSPVPYDRFKEVNDAKAAAENALKTLQEQIAADQKKRDEETGNYKKLYEEAQAKLQAAEVGTMRLRVAQAAGIPLDLADRITGNTEDELKADAERLKPFLALSKTSPNIDGGTGTTTPPTFSRAQIRDPKFFAENRTAIYRAMAEGRITE